jgi:hypothetical protein
VTAPKVEQPSVAFAAQVNAPCETTMIALGRWKKSRAHDLAMFVQIFRREVNAHSRLRPPADEKDAYALFLAGERKIAGLYGVLVHPTQADPAAVLALIAARAKPYSSRTTQLAREMHADACVRQGEGKAR